MQRAEEATPDHPERSRSLSLGVRAAMVALAANGVSAAVPSDVMFYGRSGSGSIRYSYWQSSAWTASGAGSSVTEAPDWVNIAGCPTRDETIILTISATRAARVFHHMGIYCYSATLLTSNVGGAVGRPADVAYEPSTSDALVAYWIDSAAKVGWRTSSNGTLSSETQLTLPTTNTVTYLRLVPVPGTDDIVLLALNSSNVLYTSLWSGSSWGSVTTISSTMSTSAAESFALAFEASSGDGLLVYSVAGATTVTYRTLIGGSWSAEQTGPSVGTTFDWVRLAPKPVASSNTILMGLLDHAKAVKAATWDGSAWSALNTCTSDAGAYDKRLFDVAYTPIGGQGLVAYAKSGQTKPHLKYWTGTAWSTEVTGPESGEALRFIRLAPGSQNHEVQVVWTDDGADLNTTQWSGTSLGSAALMDGSVAGSATTEPFGVNLPSAIGLGHRRIVQWQEANPH